MKALKSILAIALAVVALSGCTKKAEIPVGVQNLNENTEAVIDANPDHLVVVDFGATWCGPCKRFAPTFEAIAEEYAGKAEFATVDIDVRTDLAEQFGVQNVPTIMFILPGGSVDRVQGAREDEVRAKLEQALAQ